MKSNVVLEMFFHNVRCLRQFRQNWLYRQTNPGRYIFCYKCYATFRPNSYYDTLEVTPKASQAQIKAAYYRLSKKYHPDVNTESDAKNKFALLSEAYEIVGNRKNRSLYDRGMLTPSNMSAAHSISKDVDKEYAEFFKQRQVFRKKSDIPTGKTTIYDFDEFYRQHYGDSVKRNYQKKQESAKFEEELRRNQEDERRNGYIYMTFIAGFAFAIVSQLMQ